MQLPIEQLNLSPDCINYSKELGFSNLQEITSKGWGELQSMKGFNYIWFNEIVKFLDSIQMLHLLEKYDV